MTTVIAVNARVSAEITAELQQRGQLVDLSTVPIADAAAARVLITNGQSVTPAELLESLPALEAIVNFGVGYDGIDLEAARRLGLQISNTPDVLTDDVADLAIALLLNVARQIPASQRYIEEGGWASGPFPLATKVSGARLGLIGIGRIGLAIAHRAEAFGLTIAYTATRQHPELAYSYHADAEALAADVDFLVVAAPGGPATVGLVSDRVLRALGPQGYLINIGRGSVVDEDALVRAIESGTIAGAGLDVFAHEPVVPEGLLRRPNVVLTPHVGSATHETRRAMQQLFLKNLDGWLSDRTLVTPVE